MVAGGHAWLPGRHAGLQGACMVARGHEWLLGACVVVGCVCGCRGHAWLLGEVHGCQGVGHAWLPGGMCGCQGVCMVAGGHAWDMMRYGQ